MSDCGTGSAGYQGSLNISSDDGVTYNKIASIKSMTLNENMDTIETSSMDSDGNREYIAGFKGWAVSGEAIYVPADDAQIDILASIGAGTVLDMQYRPEGDDAGNIEYLGKIIIVSWELSQEIEDAVGFTFEATGCKKYTKQAIPA